MMLSGRTFQREGATYLKARWPYRFVLESLGPGTSRRDLDADLETQEFETRKLASGNRRERNPEVPTRANVRWAAERRQPKKKARKKKAEG